MESVSDTLAPSCELYRTYRPNSMASNGKTIKLMNPVSNEKQMDVRIARYSRKRYNDGPVCTRDSPSEWYEVYGENDHSGRYNDAKEKA